MPTGPADHPDNEALAHLLPLLHHATSAVFIATATIAKLTLWPGYCQPLAETAHRLRLAANRLDPAAKGGSKWRPMSTAPRDGKTQIVAKHKPNEHTPDGWVATITIDPDDEEYRRSGLDTIKHYNGEALMRGFHGVWEGWLYPHEVASPTSPAGDAGGGSSDLGALSAGARPISEAPQDGTHILARGKHPTSCSDTVEVRETYWRFYGKGSIAYTRYNAGEGPSGHWEWKEPFNNWSCSWEPTEWWPMSVLSAPTPDLGAQGEPVATVLWYDPEAHFGEKKPHKIIDGSMAFMDAAPIGTKLYVHPPVGAKTEAPKSVSVAAEDIARVLLDMRGFGFYTDPMEGGQDAYDISCEALNEADAILKLYAAPAAPRSGSGVTVEGIVELLGDVRRRLVAIDVANGPEGAEPDELLNRVEAALQAPRPTPPNIEELNDLAAGGLGR